MSIVYLSYNYLSYDIAIYIYILNSMKKSAWPTDAASQPALLGAQGG
jgi:hypothetical protein